MLQRPTTLSPGEAKPFLRRALNTYFEGCPEKWNFEHEDKRFRGIVWAGGSKVIDRLLTLKRPGLSPEILESRTCSRTSQETFPTPIAAARLTFHRMGFPWRCLSQKKFVTCKSFGVRVLELDLPSYCYTTLPVVRQS